MTGWQYANTEGLSNTTFASATQAIHRHSPALRHGPISIQSTSLNWAGETPEGNTL